MWVVAGLGNPGPSYEKTRHNVGFVVVDRLAEKHGFPLPRRFKSAQVRRGRVGDHDVLIVKPQTYMNLSGNAIGPIVRFYRIPLDRLIVVHDEFGFAPGVVRIKKGGGHGGHNGLRSIITHVGADFVRVRVGVGRPVETERWVEHALTSFDPWEQKAMTSGIQDAMGAVETILDGGVQAAMNTFNRREKQLPAPLSRARRERSKL